MGEVERGDGGGHSERPYVTKCLLVGIEFGCAECIASSGVWTSEVLQTVTFLFPGPMCCVHNYFL